MKRFNLPVIKKGIGLLRRHGLPLLHERFLRRKEILHSAPIKCDPTSPFEVHMQICNRDWLNALWTLKSLRAQCPQDFSLSLYLDFNVSREVRTLFEWHFKGIQIPQHDWLDEQVRQRLVPIAPGMAALWRSHYSCTLYKMVNVWIAARRERFLYLDPDVLFFAQPVELFDFVQHGAPNGTLGQFNVTALPPPNLVDCAAFCISEVEVANRYNLTLPRDFNAGIGVIQREAIDWPFIEDVLATLRWVPGRTLLVDQTCLALLAARCGWQRFDRQRYLTNDGILSSATVAAHYFGNSRRDSFYVEGIPLVRGSGLFEKLDALVL